MSLVLALLAVATILQATTPPAEPGADTVPAAAVALVETYSDGRAPSQLVSAKPGWMWTPVANLPRLPDWTPTPGSLTPAALKISRALDGDSVHVRVSMLLGRGHEQEVDVASFVLKRGDRITVDGVRAYGLQPFELSLAPVETEPLYRPRVTSITPDFQIDDVELFSAPYPGYRVTVRNVGGRVAANFKVQAHVNGRGGSSFVARGTDAQAVLQPGATTSFRLSLVGGSMSADGARTPAPVEEIEIASVFWDDGTFTGAPYAAAHGIVEDSGRRYQLTRVLAILSRATTTNSAAGLAAVRAQIEALPDGDRTRLSGAQRGIAEMKAMVLRDIAEFEAQRSEPGRSTTPGEFLRQLVARYEQILARLAPG